nr:hypothetical protein CFP56_37684 [Quercus suber]
MGVVSVFTLRGVFCKSVLFAEVDILEALDAKFVLVSSRRLSIGMTPKTLRLRKPGEMLLSVHGSPLGVYKEVNMEAIHESDEG